MHSFNVLDRHLNIFDSHFLEASAGTGKTFAIEHLVLRLLLESKESISLEQILVMTFTRASTRELKLRIRSCLEKALTTLQDRNIGIDYLAAILENGAEAVLAAKKRIGEALALFDKAQIFTLHAFCHKILSEFAFEAGIHFELNSPEDEEHQRLLRLAIKDFFRTDLHEKYCAGQIERLLGKHRYDLSVVENNIYKLIEPERAIEQYPSVQELGKRFNAALNQIPSVNPELLLEDFQMQAPRYRELKSEGFSEQVLRLGRLIEKRGCNNKEFCDLLHEKKWALEKMGPENLKVRAKKTDGAPETLHYPLIFEKMRQLLWPILKEAIDPNVILLRIARDCKERSRHLLKAAEKMTPDAILHKMQQSLLREPFAAAVRSRYQALVIDEFQDTDLVQWNIFKTLFLGHAKAFCLVGDPKQSIYGFRSADIYTYLDAASAIGPERIKSLKTNFRSEPNLVEALNRLFASRHLPGWMPLPRLGKALDVMEVLPGSNTGNGIIDDKGSLHFFIAEGKRGKGKWPNEQMEEERFFPFIAQEVQRLSCEKAIPLEQVAVLVRDRYQGQRLSAFFKKLGIASSVRRGESIIESQAYAALKELFAAVLTPADLSHLKAALGGPLIGWTASALQDAEKLLEASRRFCFFRAVLEEKGFGPFFQEFLNSASDFTDGTVLEELVSRHEITLYLHLRELAELLMAHQTKTAAKAEDLLSFLEEMEKEAVDSLLYRTEEGAGSVPILTIHMSKGLEFEVVFALGVAFRPKQKEEIVRIMDGGEDKFALFDAEKKACEEAILEQDAEKMRQLYVALTRAKKRVYIPLAFEEKPREISHGGASPAELFCTHLQKNANQGRFSQLTLADFIPILDNLAVDRSISYEILKTGQNFILVQKALSHEKLLPPEVLAVGKKNQRLASFSSLLRKSDNDHFFPQKRPEESFAGKGPHNLPPGAETGTIVHRIFEKVLLQRLHHPFQRDKIADLVQRELASSFLQGWEETVSEMVCRALTTHITCAESSFCLCDVAPEKMLQEMEFLFPVEGMLLKGFADLVFEWNRRYYLLDWKTNWLGPSDLDYSVQNIEGAMRENQYFLQAAIYAEALQRYVKLFDNRPVNESFGGAIYFFLRGGAAYHFIPDKTISRNICY